MNSLSLILRILAIVSAIAAAALFFVGKGKLADQLAATQAAEQATQAVKAELASANENISELESSLKSEQEALADEKRKLESVQSEMYTARAEVSKTQQRLSEAQGKIQALEATTKRLRTDLLELEQELATASKEGEIAQMEERIAELEKTNAELNQSIKNRTMATAPGSANSKISSETYSSDFSPKASAPLPTASIGPETTITSLSSRNGLLVLANNSELGLSLGATITLVKDLQSLGDITIVEITDNLIVANILPGANTRAMDVGTTVKLLR